MVFQGPFSALNPAHVIHHHTARPLKIHRGLRGTAFAEGFRAALREVDLDPDLTFPK